MRYIARFCDTGVITYPITVDARFDAEKYFRRSIFLQDLDLIAVDSGGQSIRQNKMKLVTILISAFHEVGNPYVPAALESDLPLVSNPETLETVVGSAKQNVFAIVPSDQFTICNACPIPRSTAFRRRLAINNETSVCGP